MIGIDGHVSFLPKKKKKKKKKDIEGCSPSTVSALVAAGHRAALLQLP